MLMLGFKKVNKKEKRWKNWRGNKKKGLRKIISLSKKKNNNNDNENVVIFVVNIFIHADN